MRVNKEIIKGLFWGVLVCVLISMCTSCKHTEYITVPEVHTEYIHQTDTFELRDTLIDINQIIIREVDSTALAEYGIRLENQEKAFLIQKDRLQKQLQSAREVKADTVHVRDSIPYPVVQEVVKTKTDYRGWYVASLLAIPLLIWLRRKLKVLFM